MGMEQFLRPPTTVNCLQFAFSVHYIFLLFKLQILNPNRKYFTYFLFVSPFSALFSRLRYEMFYYMFIIDKIH